MNKLPIGIYDDPKNQKQAMFMLDLLKSNIMLFGSAMSGKTTFIKNLLVKMHDVFTPETENVFIIDFSGALLRYKELGFVCACFDNSNEENIRRLFNKLESVLYNNTKILGGVNYPEYKKENKPAHTTFIIENFSGFLGDKRYESYQETLLKLCREGLSKGITVILTATDTAGGVARFSGGFGQKISFEMPGDNLIEIFNTKVNPPMNLQGRGLANIENQVYEFQGFLPFKDEESEFEGYMEEINAKFAVSAIPKLISFDDELSADNFKEYESEKRNVGEVGRDSGYICPATVGLDYYEMKPITIDLTKTSSIGIYGKRQSGKSNLLWLLVESALSLKNEHGLRFVLFDDGRKQLDIIADCLRDRGIDYKLITQAKEFKDYLLDEGYYQPTLGGGYAPFGFDGGYTDPYAEAYTDPYTDPDQEIENPLEAPAHAPAPEEKMAKGIPFTVFILQNKSTYTNKAGDLMRQCFPEMLSESDNKWLLIHSDIKNITEIDMRNTFNDTLSVAFLLDNIGEFVNDRGSKTVFGAMDPKELKETYARIEKGDGYFYDIDSDELLKLKFIFSDTFKNAENAKGEKL